MSMVKGSAKQRKNSEEKKMKLDLYESTLCRASINRKCRCLQDNLSSQILYGMVIIRVKMSRERGVSLKTDIGNVFLNTGLKGPTGFSDIQYLLGSAFLAANQ